jgi:hypothetical protein
MIEPPCYHCGIEIGNITPQQWVYIDHDHTTALCMDCLCTISRGLTPEEAIEEALSIINQGARPIGGAR